MTSSSLRVETFIERVGGLVDALQTVKLGLSNFYEPISTANVKKTFQKVLECIPAAALTSRKGSESIGISTDDQAKTEALFEKFARSNPPSQSRQPMRYSIWQSFPNPEGIKVGKVIIKPCKQQDSGDGSPEHPSTRVIQTQIQNSEKALQRALHILKALENAARKLDSTQHEHGLKEDIVFLIKQLKCNIATLLRSVAHLNCQRQVPRVLMKLRQRATIKALLNRIEEEKGKKRIWRF